MRPKKEPARKTCERCGHEIIQPRWANGKLDSLFSERRFCSTTCAGYRNTDIPATGRKRAQRLSQMVCCNRCQSEEQLQRHHKDRNPMNNAAENIEVLCQACHTKEHQSDGTWGHGPKDGKKASRVSRKE